MPLLLQMGEVRECEQAMRGERVAPVGSLQANKDLSPTVRQLGGHERSPPCPGQGLPPCTYPWRGTPPKHHLFIVQPPALSKPNKMLKSTMGLPGHLHKLAVGTLRLRR